MLLFRGYSSVICEFSFLMFNLQLLGEAAWSGLWPSLAAKQEYFPVKSEVSLDKIWDKQLQIHCVWSGEEDVIWLAVLYVLYAPSTSSCSVRQLLQQNSPPRSQSTSHWEWGWGQGRNNSLHTQLLGALLAGSHSPSQYDCMACRQLHLLLGQDFETPPAVTPQSL